MKKILLFTVVFGLSYLVNAQTPIQEFNFNGKLSNTKNDVSFMGNSKYVMDRRGVVGGAIRLTNSYLEAPLLNLPLSNSSRTISIWVKYNDIETANFIFGYGSPSNAQYFGLLQQSTTNTRSDLNLAGWGPANDAIVATGIANNIWYNFIVTYDGLTSKIYRNGELIKASLSPRKSTNGNIFSIGRIGASVSIDADIDDLTIYDIALSGDEVAGLYNKNYFAVSMNFSSLDPSVTIPKKKINEKMVKKVVAEKPVPVLKITKEVPVIKVSEIYSNKGLKVLEENKNEINISLLPEGTYLLKVVDLDK